MHRHDRHNTSVFSNIYYMPTKCFGQYYFGHHQVGYNYRSKLHDIWYNTAISVGVSWCKCRWLYCIIYCVVFSDNCIELDDGQKYYLLAEPCSWHIKYIWQYSYVITVMSMHNFFLVPEKELWRSWLNATNSRQNSLTNSCEGSKEFLVL